MGDAVDATMKHVLRVCATVAVLVTAGAASTTCPTGLGRAMTSLSFSFAAFGPPVTSCDSSTISTIGTMKDRATTMTSCFQF